MSGETDILKTGHNLIYIPEEKYFTIDAHMHIQSNDIAPIPIMKGVLRLKIIPRKTIMGKKINFDELTFRNPDTEKKVAPGFHAGGSVVESLPLDRELMTDVAASIMEYGKVCRYNSYLIAGMYKEESFQKTNFGIASKIKDIDGRADKSVEKGKKERAKIITERNKLKTRETAVAAYYGYNPELASKWQVIHGMELLYAHYWGIYGIPVYLFYNGEIYYITNEIALNYIDEQGGISKKNLFHAYDMPETLVKNIKENIDKLTFVSVASLLETNNVADTEIGQGEKYTHILRKTERREIEVFEAHEEHVLYQKMAALKYPLEFLPFYHFDARRFFSPIVQKERFTQMHRFLTNDHGTFENIGAEEIQAVLSSESTDAVFKYKLNIEDLKNELLSQGGLFWGIKMYCALGFPPYLGIDTKSVQNAFPLLQAADYSGIKEFYQFCASNEIPITCHGSPQGMTIADSGVYLKEYLKRTGKISKSNFPLDGKSFMNGLGLVDDFSSPASWKIVLQHVRELKLCLAHFGGIGFFDGTYEAGSSYYWQEEISKLIAEFPNVYTDLSCYTFKNDKNRINKTAEGLVKLIKRNPKLRYRLLYGTDWPMTEMKMKGVHQYNMDMFELLRLVTKNLGNEWDAWHQFAVINPLRFLGLFNETNDDAAEFTLNLNKFVAMKDNLLKFNNTKKIKRKAYLEEEDFNNENIRKNWGLQTHSKAMDAINAACDAFQEQWQTRCIPASGDMVDAEGKLVITLSE